MSLNHVGQLNAATLQQRGVNRALQLYRVVSGSSRPTGHFHVEEMEALWRSSDSVGVSLSEVVKSRRLQTSSFLAIVYSLWFHITSRIIETFA